MQECRHERLDGDRIVDYGPMAAVGQDDHFSVGEGVLLAVGVPHGQVRVAGTPDDQRRAPRRGQSLVQILRTRSRLGRAVQPQHGVSHAGIFKIAKHPLDHLVRASPEDCRGATATETPATWP